jgi:hypothetical protein
MVALKVTLAIQNIHDKKTLASREASRPYTLSLYRSTIYIMYGIPKVISRIIPKGIGFEELSQYGRYFIKRSIRD